MKQNVTSPRAVQHMAQLAKLMDSQFRIPGTNFRFGLDALIGLIPGAGDLSTFAVSGYMIMVLARNGASGYVLARMILNVLLDSMIGAIPFLGDIFDFGFKANTRNIRLMQEHYVEGRHKGGAMKVIIPVLIVLLLIIIAIVYGAYRLIAYFFSDNNTW